MATTKLSELNMSPPSHRSSERSLQKKSFYLSSFLKGKFIQKCLFFFSKPVRPSFIFRTQIKIFLMKSKSFLILHRQQRNYHFQGPERYKDFDKIVHVTLLVHYWCFENIFFCAKKPKKTTLFNNFFSFMSLFDFHPKISSFVFRR